MAARILVIENERLLSCSLMEVFQRAGYIVIPAYTGLEGFAHLVTGSFDLVILDLQLPDVNGLDLIPQIFATLPQAKVLALFADQHLETLEKSFQDRVLFYPINQDSLLQVVADLLLSEQM